MPLDHGGPIDQPFEVFEDLVFESSIIDRFGEISTRFPNRTAIADHITTMSYAQLAALANHIAIAVNRQTCPLARSLSCCPLAAIFPPPCWECLQPDALTFRSTPIPS